MEKTVKEIADLLDAELVGDPNVTIKGLSGIKEAKEGDVTFVANPKYTPLINQTRASCIITSKEIKSAPKPLIRCDNPSLAFARLFSIWFPKQFKHHEGIHPTASIAPSCKIGQNVALGAYAVVEEGATIGDRTVIYPHVFIGHDVRIGDGCLVYPNVSIRERVEIGNNVIIHSGSVVGSDGFGYATVEEVHHKIPQVGIVEIEDDVEIGACVTIDRARFGKTVIGKGTKIDNLVQVAHNVQIGPNSILVAQSGISGSVKLGSDVIMAGQSGVVGHVEIGDGAIIAAQAGVTKSVPPKEIVLGAPARPQSIAKRIFACLDRLPELFKRVAELEKKAKELKK